MTKNSVKLIRTGRRCRLFYSAENELLSRQILAVHCLKNNSQSIQSRADNTYVNVGPSWQAAESIAIPNVCTIEKALAYFDKVPPR